MDFIKETIAIRLPNGGRALINAEDFDPKAHKKWTEADAKRASNNAGDEILVTIPEKWQALKWMQKAKLARQIDPKFEPDPDDRAGSAEKVIEAELDRRATL